jgi:hypothetical protein
VQEVYKQTGATYRQMDYWCRVGYLRPAKEGEGSGYARLWSPVDIRLMKILVAFCRATGEVPGPVASRVSDVIYKAGGDTRLRYLSVRLPPDGFPVVRVTKGQPLLEEGDVVWLMHLPPLEKTDV